MNILFCPLTGTQIKSDEGRVLPQVDGAYTYEYRLIGKARIALPTYLSFERTRDFKHYDLAGICRNAFEDGKEPPLIDTEFTTNGIKNILVPKTIREKADHLLKFMYKKGGKDSSDFEFVSLYDFTIAYATGEKEFNKIMRNLETRNLIQIDANLGMSGHTVVYRGVMITELGLAEVEKDLPNIPMISLVDQEIATGDAEIDSTINHAKKTFFDAPQSMDKMRSACETLSYVLEPLRKECESLFGQKDIDAFFSIVNSFDIRHNKDSTKRIQYPEQLEWVFYSLLNTINTYSKLSKRL